jgi:asparagine synthase (glutamine-hydrolysing)
VDEYTKHLIAANMGYLRTLLLDGALVRGGVLDRSKLEAALSGMPTKGFGYGAQLCSIAATELWLAQWTGAQGKVAAA